MVLSRCTLLTLPLFEVMANGVVQETPSRHKEIRDL